MIVVINNIEYSAATKQLDAYEIGPVIGTISRKVKPNIYPENKQSNFFEEGSVIYSVKNEDNFIIAENTDGELYLLRKAPERN